MDQEKEQLLVEMANTSQAFESDDVTPEDVRQLDASLPEDALFTEVSTALNEYKKQMDLFKDALDVFSGSKRQLMRSWFNSAFAHMNKDPLQWSYEGEEELFQIFDEVISAKFVVFVHGLHSAKILTLHKPLMSSTPATQSEVDLKVHMTKIAGGEEVVLQTTPTAEVMEKALEFVKKEGE